MVGFSIAQPFLVQTTLTYIANHTTEDLNHGYGLIGAYALTYIGLAVSATSYIKDGKASDGREQWANCFSDR